ncbi:THAP domain-containing protein 2 [Nilaparvata lugens]|uniref:THAP domain-containing protein 2 n=1 Tax=Nilaparvata lugens TaxID=108931 RepID=UPI00193D0B9F|nr:THAP domain-containing protein 2 [Nilaparvata lugens]
MGFCCCVPNCRGNYQKTSKVSVFSFPKDETLKRKWIQAIRRKNFNPTKSSKVCEKHFDDRDIIKVVRAYNEHGENLEAKLNRVKLKEGAIPRFFPNCPKHWSTKYSSRESVEERRERQENYQLNQAIQKSLQSKKKYDDEFKFKSFIELSNLVDSVRVEVPSEWSVVKKPDSVLFLIVEAVPVPNIVLSAMYDNFICGE